MRTALLAVIAGLVLAVIAAAPGSRPSPVQATEPCRLDKIGTWSEVQGAGPHSIEVGGSGFQHLDLYAGLGQRTVSYITERTGRVATFSGWGSAWEGANLDTCGDWQQFPWVSDAAAYQSGRGPVRGSGLVVNVNVREAENLLVVHRNVFCRTEAEVRQIIAEQTPAWRFDNQNPVRWVLDEVVGQCGWGAPAPTTSVAVAPPPAPAPQAGNCEPAVREDRHLDGLATWWAPNGVGTGEVIVLFWTNLPGKSQAERKLRLRPSDGPVQLLGGGSSWLRPAGCSQAADNEFRGTPLPEVSLSQLREEGLAR